MERDDDESTHLSCSQGDEILCGLWDRFSKQSNDNASYVLISNPHIEVYLGRDRGIMGKRIEVSEQDKRVMVSQIWVDFKMR